MDEDAELKAALAMSMESETEVEAADAKMEVEPLSFRVTHRKDVLQLSMPPTATVADLHLKLEELTGIIPSMQKVMFKGGLKDKTKTLQDVGIKSGVKMMLVGTKGEDIAKLKKAAAAAAKEPTEEAATAAAKTPMCQEREHKRVLDKGKPADAQPGIACPPGAHAALPDNLKGLLNSSGGKVRLVFSPASGEVTFATAERTQKYPLGAFPEVTSDPILDHPGYRILGVKMGKTDKSFVYLYWVPEQYVNAITAALTGRSSSFGGVGGGNAADMEEQMLQEAIRRSMGQ